MLRMTSRLLAKCQIQNDAAQETNFWDLLNSNMIRIFHRNAFNLLTLGTSSKKKHGIIWEFFPTWGLPNSQKQKKCPLITLKSPQKKQIQFSQNHPIFFLILNKGFPKGGGGPGGLLGGGSDVWEKFSNNPAFLFEGVPYLSQHAFCQKYLTK